MDNQKIIFPYGSINTVEYNTLTLKLVGGPFTLPPFPYGELGQALAQTVTNEDISILACDTIGKHTMFACWQTQSRYTR